MSKYSMEIKALLDKKKLNKSRFNPEVSMNVTIENQQSKTLKRCQSSASIRRKNSLASIQNKYLILQQNYRTVLETIKFKAQEHQKVKAEIKKLNLEHQRDQQQIARLRSMLGFMPKKSQQTQTTSQLELNSWYNKIQKSTESGDTSDQKQHRKSNRYIKIESPLRRHQENNQRWIFKSPIKSKSPTHKYRFIPSLPFK